MVISTSSPVVANVVEIKIKVNVRQTVEKFEENNRENIQSNSKVKRLIEKFEQNK